MPKREPEEVAALYMAAWNQENADIRLRFLEMCWADDGVYTDPGVYLVGRQALSDRIAFKQAERPGAKLIQLSIADNHHDVLRFHWCLRRPDGSDGPRSLDIGITGEDGRLLRTIGFFGELPDDVDEG